MRVTCLESVLVFAGGVCEIIGGGGGIDRLLQPAFCGQVVPAFAEFVHQPHVLGAFGLHHLPSLCLTVRVDFKDSLQDDERRIFLRTACSQVSGKLNEISALLSTVTH